MSREYIPLFLDFNETTQDLTDEECGRLVRAIVDYANDRDYEDRLSGAEKIAFRFLKGLVDRNQAISEKRAKAGATRNKTEQNETNENKTGQNETNSLTKTKTKTETKTKNQNKDIQERFDRFWSAYPRHVAKPDARKEFEKLNPDEDMLQTILKAIEQQKQSDQWMKDNGQFVPHPRTWLHQKRWEDEVPTGTGKTVIAQQYGQRSYENAVDDIQAETDRMMQEFLKGAS